MKPLKNVYDEELASVTAPVLPYYMASMPSSQILLSRSLAETISEAEQLAAFKRTPSWM